MAERAVLLLLQALRGAAPLFLLWAAARACWLLHKKRRVSMRAECLLGAFVFYLLCLWMITVWRYGVDLSGLLSRPRAVNLLPLVGTLEILGVSLGAFLYNVMGNLAWFFPLGFLLPLVCRRPVSLGFATAAGALVSASIELSQLALGTGVCDIDDLLFNAAGASLGWAGLALWRFLSKKVKSA